MPSINGNPAVFTANGNETVSSFTIPFTFKQSGSGTPSLSNVRPITGFTGLTVHYTGKNMLDPQAFAKDSYYATVDDDVITIKRNDERGWVASSDIPSIFLPAGTYVISRTSEAGSFSIRTSLDSYASNLVSTSDASASFTLTDACTVKIKIFAGSGSYPFDTQLMIESGSTASTYEAYKDNTSNITSLLDNSLRTVNSSTNVSLGGHGTDYYEIPLTSGTTYTFAIRYKTSTSCSIFYRKSDDADNTKILNSGTLTFPYTEYATFTISATANYRFWAYNSNGVDPDDILWFQLEEGSIYHEPSVYSVTFPVLEKNLCPSANETFTQFKRISLGATYPAGTYRFSCIAVSSDTDSNACAAALSFDNANVSNAGTFLRDERKSVTLTATSSFNQIIFYASNNYANGAGDTATFSYMQLEEGSTMTDYEPYTNTCYGGTYNVLTGVLTVTHKFITKNTADMDNTESYPGWKHSGIEEIVGHGINEPSINMAVNVGPTVGANTTSDSDLLMLIPDTYGKTQTEWIALAMDVQVCGALQTPYTVQLDPISSFSFLSGINTIWTDVNGDITIVYSLLNGIAKIQYKENASATPVVWMDATMATAAASDILFPKTAMLANGLMTEGTGSGGSGSQTEEKDVNFYDYDGTLLYSYTATEAQALTGLPTNPTHDGLTSQGWNWTLNEIKTQLTNMGGTVNVGQNYITSNGKTEIDITLDDANFLSPRLYLAVNGTIVIDWGDETSTDTLTGTSNTTQIYKEHTYSVVGDYTIVITVSNGQFTFHNSGYAGVLNSSGSRNDTSYTIAVKAVRMGSNALIGNYAFRFCENMATITIPSSITSIGSYAFHFNMGIRCVVVPSGVTEIKSNTFYYIVRVRALCLPYGITTLGTYSFYGYPCRSITLTSNLTTINTQMFNNSLRLRKCFLPSGITTVPKNYFYYCISIIEVTIPSTVTTIEEGAFQSMRALPKITIPANVTSIGALALADCYGLTEIHFEPSTPPTLGASTTFRDLQSTCTIYVPTGKLSAYTSAQYYPSSSSYTYVEE